MAVFVEGRVSDFDELAFCKSSVQLWCRARQKPFVEVAITTGGANARIDALCVASREPKPRLWLPYLTLPSFDPGSLQELLAFVHGKLGLDTDGTEAVAFAEAGTPEAQSLAQLGWNLERYFPVQIAWSNLQSWTSGNTPLRDGIQIGLEQDLDVVARLFINAFMSEWDWYFRELGYSATNSSQDELLGIARRYVENASAYFVARKEGQAVGISSVTMDAAGIHAELHTGVGVIATAQGLGIGRALTDATLMWAKQQGANTAEIRTQERPGEPNRNIRMYKACRGERRRAFALFRLIARARRNSADNPS